MTRRSDVGRFSTPPFVRGTPPLSRNAGGGGDVTRRSTRWTEGDIDDMLEEVETRQKRRSRRWGTVHHHRLQRCHGTPIVQEGGRREYHRRIGRNVGKWPVAWSGSFG